MLIRFLPFYTPYIIICSFCLDRRRVKTAVQKFLDSNHVITVNVLFSRRFEYENWVGNVRPTNDVDLRQYVSLPVMGIIITYHNGLI